MDINPNGNVAAADKAGLTGGKNNRKGEQQDFRGAVGRGD